MTRNPFSKFCIEENNLRTIIADFHFIRQCFGMLDKIHKLSDSWIHESGDVNRWFNHGTPVRLKGWTIQLDIRQ